MKKAKEPVIVISSSKDGLKRIKVKASSHKVKFVEV